MGSVEEIALRAGTGGGDGSVTGTAARCRCSTTGVPAGRPSAAASARSTPEFDRTCWSHERHVVAPRPPERSAARAVGSNCVRARATSFTRPVIVPRKRSYSCTPNQPMA